VRRIPGLLLAVLLSAPAQANDFLVEVTRGKSLLAVSLLADLELVEDRTHLTLCYGLGAPLNTAPASHQLCAGLDHLFGEHWMGSVVLSLSPRSRYQVELVDGFRFSSDNFSTGASLGLAYQSGGWSDLELELDGTLGLSWYSAPHTWSLRTDSGEVRSRTVPGNLLAARPGVGGVILLGSGWELSLRATWFLYSGDPLEVGRISDEEITRIAGQIDSYLDTRLARTDLSSRLAESFVNTAGGRLLQADAASGLAIAPLQLQLRPGIGYRFNRTLRAQLSYGFERYVAGEGISHVFSTRWTVRMTEWLRTWASVAIQQDRPVGVAPRNSLLLSLGGELTR